MDLNTLKSALAPLAKFCSDELQFDVEGTLVTLRPLFPSEEVEVQRHAVSVLTDSQETEQTNDEDPLSRATALEYFDQFRVEVISYALVQIGSTDLRGVKTIETGETTQNSEGQEVRVREPLHVAIRKLINTSWSRGMITVAFSRYGDLMTKISEKADKVAKESVADLDAEVERVTKRLEFLKKEREKRAKGDPSVTAKQIQSLVRAGQLLEKEVDDAIQESRDSREASEEAEAPASPTPPAAPTPPPAPVVRAPPEPRRSVIPPVVPPPSSSSFVPVGPDLSEEDAVRAARAAMASSDLQTGDLSKAEEMEPVIGPDGKPLAAYRLQPETLSSRGASVPRRGVSAGETDPDPRKDTVNPRFRGPGR